MLPYHDTMTHAYTDVTTTTVKTTEVLLWDVNTAAIATGLSVRYMRRLIAEKRVPIVRIGRLIRFRPEDLRAYIDACTVPAGE